MASTYSPSLKLELPANGDQSGTWGNTVNNNFGTLVEQAITGVQAITMANVDYTLSNLNGVSDEARNAVLVVGGTNSAIKNIIAPAVNKQYTITNNTSGGFAIIIKLSTSTGISIANGTTQTVYCNGTEFYNAVTTVQNATNATNASFAVTPTFGDNTTKISTTAFVQAALAAIYPVGCIYATTVATNPNTLFGFGTWAIFGSGRVLVGYDGGTFTAGATGGSYDAIVPSHTHTASSSSSTAITDPSHNHVVNTPFGYGSTSYSGGGQGNFGGVSNNWTSTSSFTGITAATSTSTTVNATGTSPSFANLPPYIVVYMWNRTA
jgi:hypothetical protein